MKLPLERCEEPPYKTTDLDVIPRRDPSRLVADIKPRASAKKATWCCCDCRRRNLIATWVAFSVYITAGAVISVVAAALLRDYTGKDISAEYAFGGQ